MWSKRRKKFARKYDPDKHRLYLLKLWIEAELSKRIAEELDRAILYGLDDYPENNISYGIKIADEIIRKCF